MMDNRQKFLTTGGGGAALIAATLLFFLSCLNPIGFDPDKLPVIDINLSGQISTEDVTAATLYVVNLSKTVDFKQVSIRQPLNDKAADPVAQFPNSSDSGGNWKKVKTKYLQASDIEYEVGITYKDNQGAGPEQVQTTDVYATQSKGLYYVYIYRAKNGNVVIVSPNDPNTTPDSFPEPDPDDNLNININVGAPQMVIENAVNITINNNLGREPDPEDEEGSVPPVISPVNRTKMATFIVKNMTNSQMIDNVTFVNTKDGKSYSINEAINIRDKNAIALGQGAWKTTVNYTLSSIEQSTRTVTSIIVPSNDPQAIKEHYLYFYKNNRGGYDITDIYPPADIDDLLPPDLGMGRGLIKIVNNSQSLAWSVDIVDQITRNRMALHYASFEPGSPVGYGAVGYVPVQGTPEFQIEGKAYLVQITCHTASSIVVVEALEWIKDRTATITITEDMIAKGKCNGARVTITNSTSNYPVQILGMTINNITEPFLRTSYDQNSWVNPGPIVQGGSAYAYVLSSTSMPILPGQTYEAQLLIRGNNLTALIPVQISPSGALYAADAQGKPLPADQNTRSITLLDEHVPPELWEIFVPVTAITLGNNTITSIWDTAANSGSGGLGYGGELYLNSYAIIQGDGGVTPTVSGPITWNIAAGSSCSIDVARLINSGVVKVTGRVNGSGSDTLNVTATIPGAGAGRGNFVSAPITITLDFVETGPSVVAVSSMNFTCTDPLEIDINEMVDLRSLVTFSPGGATATVYDLDWAINSQTNVQLTGAVVKGLSEGTATVTATLPGSKNGNGGTVTKTLQVKVKPDPNVMVRIIYKDAQQVDTVTRVIFVPVASTSYAPSLSYTAVCPANHGAFYIGHIGGKLVTNARCYNILRHNSGHSNIYWANSQNDVMYAQNFTIRFSTRTEYAFDIPLSIKNDYRDVQVPRGNYFVFFMEGTGHVRGYIDNVNNVDPVHGMNKLLWVDLDYLNPITVPGGDKRVVLEFNERWNTAAVRQSYDYPIIGD